MVVETFKPASLRIGSRFSFSQCSPSHAASHVHAPLLHSPLYEQSAGPAQVGAGGDNWTIGAKRRR